MLALISTNIGIFGVDAGAQKVLTLFGVIAGAIFSLLRSKRVCRKTGACIIFHLGHSLCTLHDRHHRADCSPFALQLKGA